MERPGSQQDQLLGKMASSGEDDLRDVQFVYKQVARQRRKLKDSLNKLDLLKKNRKTQEKNSASAGLFNSTHQTIDDLKSRLLEELSKCTSQKKALEYRLLSLNPSEKNATLFHLQDNILEALFGDAKDASGKIKTIKHSHKKRKLWSLVYTRSLWDVFAHLNGSPIPSTWVVPPEPSDLWKAYVHA